MNSEDQEVRYWTMVSSGHGARQYYFSNVMTDMKKQAYIRHGVGI